jgi:hypothetical protein
MRRRLPVLPESLFDDIQIATPCNADWNAMPGDDRVRHCPDCKLSVYNVAAMSRREAGLLIQEREGRLCLRLFRRADGTLITADCWEKLRAARRRGRLAFACALVLVCLIHLGIRAAAVRALLAHVAGEPPPSVMMGDAVPDGHDQMPAETPPPARNESGAEDVDRAVAAPAGPPAIKKPAHRHKARPPRVVRTYPVTGGLAPRPCPNENDPLCGVQ